MTEQEQKRKGVVILGHGSRLASGLEVVTQTVERYAQLHPDWRVEPAFLQLASPGLEDAAKALAAAGVLEVMVVPLFLSFGAHCANDMPDAVQVLREAYPHMTFRLTPPIGADPLLCDIVEKRVQGMNG